MVCRGNFTPPLGDIRLQPQGGVYQVGTAAGDIGEKTRGVKIEAKEGKQEPLASEFYEHTVVIETTP